MTPLSENVCYKDTWDLGYFRITERKPITGGHFTYFLILVSNSRELEDKKDNQINSPTYWSQATGQVWARKMRDDNEILSSFDMVILINKSGQKATISIQNTIMDPGKRDSEELV